MVKIRALGLQSNLKGLLLVGGFGKSEYLRNRLKQEFSERNDPKVWATDDAWTAVVRGAVSCEASALGRQAPIHSRLSGYNYGIAYVDHVKRRKVHWLVRKGESVCSDMATEPYGLRIDDQPWLDQDKHCLVYVPIVTSGDDDPTDDYTDAVTSHAEIKCRVPTALRFKSEANIIQLEPSKAWHIPATLVLYFDGALITFRCNIEGQEVGVAEVNDFQNDIDYVTAEDPTSESEPSLLEKRGKHFRVDSKISIGSESSSSVNLSQLPSKSKDDLMPVPSRKGKGKETVLASPPSSPPAPPERKQKKKNIFNMWTGRDRTGEQHYSHILAPSGAWELPKEKRLNGVYRKGWTPRHG